MTPAIVAVLLATVAPAGPPAGLVAWYDLAPLHEHSRDGDAVPRLADTSGNEHELVAVGDAPPATFRVGAVAGKPAVVLPKYESYAVSRPYSLDDFTLAIVYRPNCSDCGLLRSERPGEDGRGVILRAGGTQDILRIGTRSIPFGAPVELASERFVVALLGRRNGQLLAELDGRDVSAGARYDPPLRVGRFFNVSRSRAVKDDAEGMEIAELMVFSRWLDGNERRDLTARLGERYGIEIAAPAPEPAGVAAPPSRHAAAAWLTLRSPMSLPPGAPATVPWSVIDKQSLLIRPDATAPGRVGCSEDGTRVRLHLELLVAEPPGVSVRALFLVNGATYLPEQGQAEDGRLVLDAVTVLNAGDVVEAVAVAEVVAGEPGAATVEPAGSFLAVTPD